MPLLTFIGFSPLSSTEQGYTKCILYYERADRRGLGRINLLDTVSVREMGASERHAYQLGLFGRIVILLTDYWNQYRQIPDQLELTAGERTELDWRGFGLDLTGKEKI